MIRLLLQRVGVSRFNRPRVVICVPSAITEVERRAVTEAARRAGAADAHLIEQPMAAAIGAGLPDRRAGRQHGHRHRRRHDRDRGDLARRDRRARGGAGRHRSTSTPRIQTYVRREYGIAIGERTAEEIKVAIGSA